LETLLSVGIDLVIGITKTIRTCWRSVFIVRRSFYMLLIEIPY